MKQADEGIHPADDPTPPIVENPLIEHLGGPPSPWAVTLLWSSVAALGVVLALLITSLLV
jgi:hypothetical protein